MAFRRQLQHSGLPNSRTANVGDDGDGPSARSESIREPAEESVRGVVSIMQAELDSLFEQTLELRHRIRKLRRTLRKFLVTKNSSRGRQSRKLHHSRAAASRANGHKIRTLHELLERACRIALMEAGGEASIEQIQSLIVRRDSFSFDALDDEPLAAIARTLQMMIQTGEVRCLSSEDGSQLRYAIAAR